MQGTVRCSVLLVQGTIGAWYWQYGVLQVQSSVSTGYYRYKVLFKYRVLLSTRYCRYRVPSVQGTVQSSVGTRYYRYKVLSVQGTVWVQGTFKYKVL